MEAAARDIMHLLRVSYTHITALHSCRGVCDEVFVHFILFLKKPRHIIGIGRLPVHRKTHTCTDEKSP